MHRVKMLQLAQTNLFTPERKKGGGGGTHWRFVANCWQGLGLGGIEYAGKSWTWTPTWLALMDFVGFSPEAANRGAYAGVPFRGGGGAHLPPSLPRPRQLQVASPTTR